MATKAQFALFDEVEPEPEKAKPPATATFDAKQSEARKRRGMSAAACVHGVLLDELRPAMEFLAMSRPSREADGDDVQRWLIEHGHTSADLGNAAGSAFKYSAWEPTGEWKKSERASNNGRKFQVWRLK
jgi:hypothetical protein